MKPPKRKMQLLKPHFPVLIIFNIEKIVSVHVFFLFKLQIFSVLKIFFSLIFKVDLTCLACALTHTPAYIYVGVSVSILLSFFHVVRVYIILTY